MGKNIIRIISLCLLLLPVQVAVAANFVSPEREMREIHKIGWRMVAYRADENGDKVRLCSETIYDSAAEKLNDGRVIYHAKYFTIIEPATADGQMVLRVNNINVDNKLFSEVFALNAGNVDYVTKTKLEKVFIRVERVRKKSSTFTLY